MRYSSKYNLYVDNLGNTFKPDGSPKIQTPSGDGYLTVSLGGKNIHAQWVVADAWLGPRPDKFDVCHKDADRHNNRPGNLYYASRSKNLKDKWNISGRTRGKSKYIGVGFSKRENKWKAYCDLPEKGGRKWLGTYTSDTEAAKAVNKFIIENNLDFRLNPI